MMMIIMMITIIHIYEHANTKTEAYDRELAKHFKPPPPPAAGGSDLCAPRRTFRRASDDYHGYNQTTIRR